MNTRELTRSEKSRINKLVSKHCANFDEEYGCLPLDGECYMKTIGYTDSPLCKYFLQSVLPLDPDVQRIFFTEEMEICRHCGNLFPKQGKMRYCSQLCRTGAKRRNTRNRIRKYRNNKDKM